ncbi:MAG: TolC family protein [Deltaproteobacteria bacterium]|nr:TolC family protein [Deltaproteobacteria bacterium]
MHLSPPTRRGASLIPLVIPWLLGAAPDDVVERTPAALAAFARAHNPRVRAATLESAGARRAAEGADTLPDPMLELRAAPLSVPGLLPPDPHGASGFGAELMVAQRFPLSGRLGHEAARTAALARGVSAERDSLLLDLEREAALVACGAWEAATVARVRGRHVEVLGAMADVARAQIASGRATVGDAQRLDAETARLSLDVLESEGELAALDVETNLLLGRAAGAPLPAPGEQVPWLLAEPSAPALDERDEVRREAAQVEAAQAERARANAAWVPDLSASLGYSSMWPLSHAFTVGVGVELPVFFGGRSAERDAAGTMEQAAAARLDEARRRVTAELAAARARDAAAARMLAVLEERVAPLASARAQTARAALSGGAALDAALDATNEERAVELERTRATAARCRARAELWRAAGVSFLATPAPSVTP